MWPMPVHLCIVRGYFHATMAEPGDRDCMAPKIFIWSSREKLANLWDQTGKLWGLHVPAVDLFNVANRLTKGQMTSLQVACKVG